MEGSGGFVFDFGKRTWCSRFKIRLKFIICKFVSILELLQIHSGPENLKKIQAKKLVESNESISRIIFSSKFHFLQFQKWPKINFWTGKTAKNAISRKKIFDLFDFTSFFARTFLTFLARYVNNLSKCIF